MSSGKHYRNLYHVKYLRNFGVYNIGSSTPPPKILEGTVPRCPSQSLRPCYVGYAHIMDIPAESFDVIHHSSIHPSSIILFVLPTNAKRSALVGLLYPSTLYSHHHISCCNSACRPIPIDAAITCSRQGRHRHLCSLIQVCLRVACNGKR